MIGYWAMVIHYRRAVAILLLVILLGVVLLVRGSTGGTTAREDGPFVRAGQHHVADTTSVVAVARAAVDGSGEAPAGFSDRYLSSASIRVGLGSPTTLASTYDIPVQADAPPRDVRDIIRGAAAVYGVNPQVLLDVAWCESKGNPWAVGDHGESVGLWQFKLGTFLANARRAGLPYTDDLRRDPGASSMVAAFMFSTGEAKQWTCARTLGYA